MRFWDTSALVPLAVRQSRTADAERWAYEDSGIVAWTLTHTEMLSAIHRLVREQALAPRAAVDAERISIELMERAQIITDVEAVKLRAARIVRVHPLRAADALQLAAALAWADGRPTGAVFHTFDARLGQAAEREGFRVIPDA